jgi:hypothetical protein
MKRKDCRWLLDSCGKSSHSGSCTPIRLRQYIDYDYVNKLTEEEQIWLARFSQTYYMGNKNEQTSDWSKQEMSACYLRNNSLSRCVNSKSPHYYLKDNHSVTENPETSYEDKWYMELLQKIEDKQISIEEAKQLIEESN